MSAVRFVACTLNLWADRRWPERREALEAFLALHRPDVLAVQELRPATRDAIDAALPGHARVEDSFAGWEMEGNVWWCRDLFTPLAHGAEEIGQVAPARRLFWVRLAVRGGGAPLLVSTAHLTWPGEAREAAGAPSPRPAEARRAAAALDRLAGAGDPVLLLGDLNDSFHPLHVLREAGLRDAFTALGRAPLPTIPAVPTTRGIPSVADWILHRGPLAPMSADVAHFYHGDLAPSDHFPVLATYRLEGP